MDELDEQFSGSNEASYAKVSDKRDVSSAGSQSGCTSGSRGRNQRSSFNDFVRKLFLILESEEYRNIISWSEDGKNFIVMDTNKFTTDILPKHFKHSNFASFVRQLNKYDFHKVKRKKNEVSEGTQNAWEFNHQHFRRHDEAGLDNIRRKPSSQKKILLDENSVILRKLGNGNPEEGFAAGAGLGGLGGGDEDSLAAKALLKNTVNKAKFNQMKRKVEEMESQIQYLTNENHNVKLDLQKIQSRYNMVLETLLSTESFNTELINNFHLLIDSLSQQGIKLPVGLTLKKNDSSLLAKQKQEGGSSGSPPNLNMIGLPVSNPVIKQDPVNILPIDQQQQHQQQQQQQQQSVLPRGFHVLLVEDDSVCIQLCSKFLRKYGCSVEVVTDGLSAISTLEKQRFDLVLMDIVMPNLDGATATSIVRSFDNETPIIAMTGNIDDQDLVTYLQHGMNDILAKPFTKDDLHSMLIRYLKDRIPLSKQGQNSNNDPKSFVENSC
ncbi:HSF DNA-bind super family [Kluyveromyces marxianus]|uniref:Transcription factor n=2 Tax=Kluyveromyces marxianus TaxID=4911 RepID=W0T3E7_KLUMD|nr:uncharacterized protein KLMA_10510 [Kluyveromyces marxianus DMKU3-1042]QGN13691.1 HSF_DNA-bind super family [Kluyveromyces marxianus]BAO38132.1 HSF_DNA-bind super family [Kluyveromyces marxianus DMKU3-1042]BAP69700.1 HSF DNA-bind super family [Kluyveromyces marxianus]